MLIKRGYKQQEINEIIERTKALDRKKDFQRENKKKKVIEYQLYWHSTVHYLM